MFLLLGDLVVSAFETSSLSVFKKEECDPVSLSDLLSHLLRWALTFLLKIFCLFHVIHVHFQEIFKMLFLLRSRAL